MDGNQSGEPPDQPSGEAGSHALDPWVSADDIAAHLGVAKDSVYRWIEERRLPAHRIGRLWKFKRSEVDAWVRSGGAGQNSTESSEGKA